MGMDATLGDLHSNQGSLGPGEISSYTITDSGVIDPQGNTVAQSYGDLLKSLPLSPPNIQESLLALERMTERGQEHWSREFRIQRGQLLALRIELFRTAGGVIAIHRDTSPVVMRRIAVSSAPSQGDPAETAPRRASRRDTAEMGLAVCDHQGTILYADQNFLSTAGRSQAELAGKNLDDLFVGTETAYRSLSNIREHALKSGQTRCDAIRAESKLDRYWCALELHRIDRRDGPPLILVSETDVTAQKNTELMVMLKHFSIDCALEPVIWCKPSGDIVYANESACAYFRQSRRALCATNLESLIDAQSFGEWSRAALDSPDNCNRRHHNEVWAKIPGQPMRRASLGADFIRFDDDAFCCLTILDLERARIAEDKLSESQKRLTLVFTGAHDGIILIDHRDEIIEANPAVSDMLGVPTADLLGMTIKQLEDRINPTVVTRSSLSRPHKIRTTPDDDAEDPAAEQGTGEGSFEIVCDGARRIIAYHLARVSRTFTMMTFRDETSRHRRELAFTLAAQGVVGATGLGYYRQLLQFGRRALSLDSLVIVGIEQTPEGIPDRIHLREESMTAALAADPQASGEHLAELIDLAKSLNAPETTQQSPRLPNDDVARSGLRTCVAIHSADGKVIGALCAHARDSSPDEAQIIATLRLLASRVGAEFEREKAEERLEQAAKTYRRLLEGLPDAAIITIDGKIAYANIAAESIWKTRASELIGKPTASLFVEGDDPGLDLTPLTGPRIAVPELYTARLPDGSSATLEGTASRTLYDGAAADLLVLRDVTLREKLQRELEQAQRMEAIGQLSSGVAHDFNNFVAVIYSEVLAARQHCTSDNDLLSALNTIQFAAEQAGSVTQALLAFAGNSPVERVRTSLKESIELSAGLLRRILPDTITLSIALPSTDEAFVLADANQMQQVLMNLVINARDAITDGGEITIRLTCNTTHLGFATIAVEDDGVGIDPEIINRVIEPFFTTKPRGQGTGLGLSITRGIVDDHKGHLHIDSTLGQGTTVTVTLPLDQSAPGKAIKARPRNWSLPNRHKGKDCALHIEHGFLAALVRTIVEEVGLDIAHHASEPGDTTDTTPTRTACAIFTTQQLAAQPAHAQHYRSLGIPIIVLGDPPQGHTNQPTLSYLAPPFGEEALQSVLRNLLDTAP